MRVQLITPYWRSGHEQRDAELEQCEAHNLRCFGKSGVVLVGGDRPTFGYLFDLCDPEGINIVSNSDIYWTKRHVAEVVEFYKRLGNERTCMALSRWDELPSGELRLYDHQDSQDSWIFMGRPNVKGAEFHLGIPGCDNRIAKLIEESGYTVINPSRIIRSYHLHGSGFRTYGTGRGGVKTEAIPGPYKFIKPHTL